MYINQKCIRDYYHDTYSVSRRDITHRYDPKLNLCYTNIPKCMSKNLIAVFEKMGLFTEEIPYTEALSRQKYNRFLVFMREPLDRWYSGIIQYLTITNTLEYLKDPSFCKMLLDGIEFDEHTTRQIEFLAGVDTSSSIFFDCTTDITDVFKDFMCKSFGIELDFQFANKDPISEHKRILMDYITSYSSPIDSGPDIIKRYYRPDYLLMSNISWTYTTIDYKNLPLA